MIRRLAKCFLLLADFPGMGPARDDLRAGVRTFPERNYVILYRVVDDGVDILRVVDGRRDLKAII
jgi:toxin ParE1/3/4